MSEVLEIKNLKIDSIEASCEVYLGHGRWEKLEVKKDRVRVGVMTHTDYEALLELHDVDDQEVWDAVEDLMDGLYKILNATLNIIEEGADE